MINFFRKIRMQMADENRPLKYMRYPLKDMDSYGPLNWKEPSVLKIDKYKIFQEIQYENLIDDFMFRMDQYIDNLKILQTVIKQILTESGIKN